MCAGRDDALDRLDPVLTQGSAAVVTQVVYGLGGVGKCELALQYTHQRYRRSTCSSSAVVPSATP